MDVGRGNTEHADIVEHAYYIATPEGRTGSHATVDCIDAEFYVGQIGSISGIGCGCSARAIDCSEGQVYGVEHFGVGCGYAYSGGEEEIEGSAHGVALVGGERERSS